jgi:hypothetical protein
MVSYRFQPPSGFERVSVSDGTFGAILRDLKLKPEGTNARNQKGEDILCEDEIISVIDERPLPTKESKGAEAVLKLWGAYRWSKGRTNEISFGLDNGQRAQWKDWRDGLRPRAHEGRMLFVQVGVPDGSQANYLKYLTFVAENAGSISLKRDLEVVVPDHLAPGDVIVSSEGNQGRAALVLDICRNPHTGERLLLLGMGGENGSDIYIPRPYEPVQGEGAWFTMDGACYAVGRGQPTTLRHFPQNP